MAIVFKDKRVVILDGGFGTQLSLYVPEKFDGDALWSSKFIATDKEAIIKTHLDYLKAGSDIITTNTYQASIGGFVRYLGLNEQQSYDLIKEAVVLAKTAKKRYQSETKNDREILIAGSVGPYGASLHDDSEYTGSYVKTTPLETIREWHIPRIKALLEAGVDLLALETIPSRVEAEILTKLLKEQFPKTRAWLSFSTAQDGKRLASGDNFQETAKFCYDLNPQQLVAVGVNCLSPDLVQTLFEGINSDQSENPRPLIVYSNSGEKYDSNLGWTDKDKCAPLENYVSKWLDLGVRFIGGCCRVYDKDMMRIIGEVRKWEEKHL